MNAEQIKNTPSQMSDAERWLLWKSVPNNDPEKKPRKVPYYSNGRKRHGALDTPEDIANLTSLDVALRAFESGRYTGLGFALGYDGGGYWQGIDFDELSKNTNLTHLISGLPGYVEKSPSGDGVHAIGYGKHFISMGSNSTGIEAYCEGRYFTVTGNVVVNNPSTCLSEHIEGNLRPIHSPPKPIKERTYSDELNLNELRSALFSLPADDRDIWVRIGHALKTLGEPGRALFMEWSATSPKHDPDADARTWDSFAPT